MESKNDLGNFVEEIGLSSEEIGAIVNSYQGIKPMDPKTGNTKPYTDNKKVENN